MHPAHDTARDLAQAFAAMSFTLEDGRFVLAGFPGPPALGDLAVLERPPAQLVREADETTLLLREELLPDLLARHPEARVECDLCWIRFEAVMGWEVVGFLARVTGALAAAGVPLGAVCGYSRDHLFVAEPHLPRAIAALEQLFPGGAPGAPGP